MSAVEAPSSFDRVRGAFLAVAALVAVVIWYLLTAPARGGPPSFFWKLMANGGHAFLFFLLTWPLLSGVPRRSSWRLPALAVAATYAVATEIAQNYLDDRFASFGDVLTDCTGILLGWALVQWTQCSGAARRSASIRVLAAACLCFSVALADTLRD